MNNFLSNIFFDSALNTGGIVRSDYSLWYHLLAKSWE